ncbi:MAG: hypothetical protein R2693_06615 [Nocardioidaceae bacterium]
MDCGIPFCHQGCPLGNLIPEWNDLSIETTGMPLSKGCMPPTTSQISQGDCALPV